MSKRVLRVAALAAACVAVLAAGPAGPTAPKHAHPERLVLRLADVGPGYLFHSDDSGCGLALVGEGILPELKPLYMAHPHVGCTSEFLQVWAPDGSPPRADQITSAAFVFGDAAGPAAELRYSRQVAAYISGSAPEELTPAPAPTVVGTQTIMLHTPDHKVADNPDRPSVVVLWRSGPVLGGVAVDALPVAAGEQEALRLAAVQQARIEHPAPLGENENDSLEVPLDNPRLGIDVHWLGRRFAPRGRLPRLHLTSADGPLRPGEGPGEVVSLEYGRRPFGDDVRLGVWRRRAWARNARTRFGRLIWHERCTRVERVPVSGGYALIYAGHEVRRTRCDGAPADRFLAHVFLGGTVVTVNEAVCLSCREGGGAYDSRAGMLAVVRGLRERTPKIVRSP
jgi:hypothetical protein